MTAVESSFSFRTIREEDALWALNASERELQRVAHLGRRHRLSLSRVWVIHALGSQLSSRHDEEAKDAQEEERRV